MWQDIIVAILVTLAAVYVAWVLVPRRRRALLLRSLDARWSAAPARSLRARLRGAILQPMLQRYAMPGGMPGGTPCDDCGTPDSKAGRS